MKRMILPTLFTLIPIFTMADTLKPLESFRWKHRIILYTVDDHARRTLGDTLEQHTEAIRDRDLVFVNLSASDTTGLPNHLELPAPHLQDLRATLKTKPSANEMILIGKDGGVKERIDRIDLPYLFDAIDQMPMRRAEMRRP